MKPTVGKPRFGEDERLERLSELFLYLYFQETAALLLAASF